MKKPPSQDTSAMHGKNTKSRSEVLQDTGRRVSKARDEGGQNPRGNIRDKRDERDRNEHGGYAT